MQEDLAYCAEQFNDFMKLIDEDIQNGQLTTGKITTVEVFIGLMLKIIKQTMIEALRDQEEESENHENPTNASAH